MDPREKQRRRQLEVLREAEATIAEADRVLAKANAFFNGEGLLLRRKLESLPEAERQRIEQQARQEVQKLQEESTRALHRQFFGQHNYGYKPRMGRRLA
jgi:hypothetical protein